MLRQALQAGTMAGIDGSANSAKAQQEVERKNALMAAMGQGKSVSLPPVPRKAMPRASSWIIRPISSSWRN